MKYLFVLLFLVSCNSEDCHRKFVTVEEIADDCYTDRLGQSWCYARLSDNSIKRVNNPKLGKKLTVCSGKIHESMRNNEKI